MEVTQEISNDSGTPQDSKASEERVITIIGFSLMLAWHYLILFTPALGNVGAYAEIGQEHIFYRQLTLYSAIAVSFFLIWLYGKWKFTRNEPVKSKLTKVVLTGIASVLAGVILALCRYFGASWLVQLVFIAILGMLQAYMMTQWMRCLMRRYNGNVISSFGIFMAAGGAIAIIICLLQWPIMIIATVILPGISSVFLGQEWIYDRKQETLLETTSQTEDEEQAEDAIIADAAAEDEKDSHESQTEEGAAESKRISTRNNRMILFAGVFSLTIGLLQGSFILINIPILIVEDSVVLLGIVLAGLLLHFIPKNLGITLSVDMMHRFSVILFVIGCVLAMWYPLGSTVVLCCQIALLAGFNLFDFGLFSYGIEGYLKTDKKVPGADPARPIVYLCMASGMLIGHTAVKLFAMPALHDALLVTSGFCIVLVVCTTLLPFLRLARPKSFAYDSAETTGASFDKNKAILSLSSFPTETSIVDETYDSNGGHRESYWKNACKAIAVQYKLSPRETEIFMLLAKGRNADYIQSKLIISTHTAKTHIANIYHKLAIHSAQELLDLVENYRYDDKRK